MTNGMPLLIAEDVIGLLRTSGILLPDGNFDPSRVDTLQENAQFLATVEAILLARGMGLPEVIHAVIGLLPILGMFIRLPKPKGGPLPLTLGSAG